MDIKIFLLGMIISQQVMACIPVGETVDLRNPGYSMQYSSTREQGSLGICYAEASSQVFDSLWKQESPTCDLEEKITHFEKEKRTFHSSAALSALVFKKSEYLRLLPMIQPIGDIIAFGDGFRFFNFISEQGTYPQGLFDGFTGEKEKPRYAFHPRFAEHESSMDLVFDVYEDMYQYLNKEHLIQEEIDDRLSDLMQTEQSIHDLTPPTLIQEKLWRFHKIKQMILQKEQQSYEQHGFKKIEDLEDFYQWINDLSVNYHQRKIPGLFPHSPFEDSSYDPDVDKSIHYIQMKIKEYESKKIKLKKKLGTTEDIVSLDLLLKEHQKKQEHHALFVLPFYSPQEKEDQLKQKWYLRQARGWDLNREDRVIHHVSYWLEKNPFLQHAPLETRKQWLLDSLKQPSAYEGLLYLSEQIFPSYLRKRGRKPYQCSKETNNERFSTVLTKHFSQSKAISPVMISYNSSIFRIALKDQTLFHRHHLSVIIGIRHRDKQQCEYLIRNSWGLSCKQYEHLDGITCDKGDLWVREDLLIPNTYHLSFPQKK
jgi:hypothetical protein